MSATDLDRFVVTLARACADDTFVGLTLSSPTHADASRTRETVRLVALRDVPHLSFTGHEARRDTVENVAVEAGVARVRDALGSTWRAAMLATTSADWQLRFDKRDRARLIRHPARQRQTPDRTHDRDKPSLLGVDAQPWLERLGIVDARGRPVAGMARKHQQIDRYIEILGHVARDGGLDRLDRPVTVVDVGCGRGGLTFGVWHLFERVLRRPVDVLGVEARDDLVAAANAHARAVGATSLRFATGDIEHVPLPDVDVLIALHACNTATDHAIRRGIQSRARVIVCAPCCHQQLRPQLGMPEPLAPVLRHGLFAERMAEWVTDGLRTLVLEWAGYRTKAIEFVDSEHTPKNLLLVGVRGDDPAFDPAKRAAIDAFRTFFGIATHPLDALSDASER